MRMLYPLLVLLPVLLTPTLCDTTTTDSLYHCFQSNNCFLLNNCINPDPNKNTSRTEMNRCLDAEISRDMCLLMNNCNFTGEQQYSKDCWHCWVGVETRSTIYKDMVSCIDQCFKAAERLLAMVVMGIVMAVMVVV